MAKTRDILKHVDVETAVRKRRCYRDKNHAVVGGSSCLVIKEGMMTGSKNYCSACAQQILLAARSKLENLAANLAR